jgi:UDP-glucose 6-dehydrogenase
MPYDNHEYREKAGEIMSVLPRAPYETICGSLEAEFIKYGRNVSGFFRVIFTNLLYDAVIGAGGDWDVVKEAMSSDPDNGPTYMNPVHKSGRGAGGHCFIKDFAAFKKIHEDYAGDEIGQAVLDALEKKNISLLVSTRKDLDLLKGVYGDEILEKEDVFARVSSNPKQ